MPKFQELGETKIVGVGAMQEPGVMLSVTWLDVFPVASSTAKILKVPRADRHESKDH